MWVGVHSDIGARTSMEDDHLILMDLDQVSSAKNNNNNKSPPQRTFKPHCLFGVFDGHAGKEASTFARQQIANCIVSSPSFEETEDACLALIEGFKELDRRFLAECGESRSTPGSTLLVALIRGGRLFVANAGDSRAVLARGGRAIPLSVDHKPKRPDEKTRIEEAGGFVSWDRVGGMLAVSRAMGDFDFKSNGNLLVTVEPEIQTTDVTTPNTHFLIMACDGLWDVISNQEAVNYVYKVLEEEQQQRGGEEQNAERISQVVSEKMVSLAMEKDSADNVTVMVILFQSPEEILSSRQ